MADAKKIKVLFSDEKKDEKKSSKKIKIVKKTTVKMADFKNILVAGSAAIACFNALTKFGPRAVAYGGPVAMAITVGFAAFEMWSSKQIRKYGQIKSTKHSIKKHESSEKLALRNKNTDDGIVIAQMILYLVSMTNLIPFGPIVPAVLFGATGIAAKLVQMISNEKVVQDEKGKAK